MTVTYYLLHRYQVKQSQFNGKKMLHLVYNGCIPPQWLKWIDPQMFEIKNDMLVCGDVVYNEIQGELQTTSLKLL